MAEPTPNRYIWIDLETTGLSPGIDWILEAAIVITDSDLNELAAESLVRRIDDIPAAWESLRVNEFVRDMHRHNCLWDDCKGSPYGPIDLSEMMKTIIFEHGAVNATLAGASVGFDRGFLEIWMPDVACLLHYRSMDVSVVKRFVKDVHPDASFERGDAHRAMLDIRESIENLKTARTFLMEPWHVMDR